MITSVAYLSMHTSPLAQPGTGNAGGMNVYVNELSRMMAARGIDVVVFTRRTDESQPPVVRPAPGYRVVHVDAGPPEDLPVARLPEFVAGFASGVVGWARRENARFDVVHSHYWLSGWSGVLVKRALGVPLLNSFHTLGRVKELAARTDEPATAPIRTLTEDEVLARSDAVVASTPHEVEDLVTHYGADPARVLASPPGVDHRVFRPGDRAAARGRLGLAAQPLILSAGRVEPHKGIDVAVRAVAKLPERVAVAPGPPRLLVVGGRSGSGGHDEPGFLRRLAAELGICDRVHFAGPQPHRSLVHFYRAADILVMPSRSESFGLVAAEAQACGLPVVAADVGGLRYVVDDGGSGHVVAGSEAAGFADALLRVLDDPEARGRLSAGAVTKARQFSWEATALRLLQLYERIRRR